MIVLAIASAGGHWIQLLRLKPAFEANEVVFLSTKESFSETVKGHRFYSVPDANRKEKLRLILMMFKVMKVVFTLKPQVIITTGAAPGLIGLLVGKLIRSKTIWIDSIANVERISLSGRIAKLFSDQVYTQWPHLASKKIIYKGNVLS
ncbi:MAG: oligosaccharide biosynthesis protein Alg14 [Flavobacterium sp.]|nr:MAG: oligosaccharide biosynthesis protein Alg14 [Flavobacterium sp.]